MIKKYLVNIKIDFFPKHDILDMIYEDQDLIIIKKKENIVVYNYQMNTYNALINNIIYYYPYFKYLLRYGVLHRLDKCTTGILIFAKNIVAQFKLLKLFKKKKIFKHYLAIANGDINKNIILKNYIKKIGKKSYVSNTSGKYSITRINIIKKKNEYLLLSIILETGRTHQIRCHLEFLKCYILNDVLYGYKKKKSNNNNFNIFLHANCLIFKNPINNFYIKLFINIPNNFDMLINFYFC